MLSELKYIVLFFVYLFCFIQSSHATNYYISTTGNNANAGTSVGTAKATLANVFSSFNLGIGDTIFVAAGTYTEKRYYGWY